MSKKDINFWVKLDGYFINFNLIRSASRISGGTMISLTTGEEFIVDLPFEKVQKMIEKQ